MEAHGFYVPPLNEIAEEYSEPQKTFAGSLSEEENSGIDVARLAQSSVKPSISSTALRDDVSRSAKPKLGEAGFLEGFDPELARLISAPEAGSVKVNPRVAAKQEAEAEQLDALNVLEELGSARYEIQRGDTLSGIAQAHGTTVEALALANKISNPDMIYAGETLEMAADGGMMPYRMYDGRRIPDIKRIMAQLGISEELLRQATPEQRAVYEEAMNKAIERERAAGIADLDTRGDLFTGGAGVMGAPILYEESTTNAQARDRKLEREALGDRGYLEGPDITRTFNENVLAAEQARDRKPFAPGTLDEYAARHNIPESEFADIFAQFGIDDAADAKAKAVALAGGNGAGNVAGGLSPLAEFVPQNLDFANLDLLLQEGPIDYKKLGIDYEGLSPIDYKGLGVDYAGLLAKEEARSRQAAEESRRDAGSNALIQLGAGIAGGDMAGGISKAGEAAMLSRREAREEEKEFGALARQIDLAERQQVSTLGLEGAKAGREQKMALARFGLEKQQAAIQSDKNVYDAYMKMKRLEADMNAAPTDEERRVGLEHKRSQILTDKERAANLAYKVSQTGYMDAVANSKVYDTAFTEEDLQTYIDQAMSTPEGHRQLSEMSDTKRKDWARRAMMMSGGVPEMIPGGATGYSEGVLVGGGG